jgi:hypothetical protein
MKTAIKLTLLAALGVASVAAAPVLAQAATEHRAHHERSAGVHGYRPGEVYLLENRGAINGPAANTNAAEDFQSNWDIGY